jgi:ribonucleoside-triphosphate reductase
MAQEFVLQVLNKYGKVVPYNSMKIVRAAWAALMDAGHSREEADEIASCVAAKVHEQVVDFMTTNTMISYEAIHRLVEEALMELDKNAARNYIEYRNTRKQGKKQMDDILNTIEAISRETDKNNANTLCSPASKMAQIAESVNKFYALEHVLPKDMAEAHKLGQIYIHDLGFYKITYNCLNFAVSDLLNDMKMPHGYLRRPKHIGTAFALAAIALQSAANSQFGGIGINNIDTEMSEFLSDSDSYDELFQACEGFIGNLNTLHARAGNQVPFTSITLGMDTSPKARLITKAILEAYEAGLGHGEQPMFPNILFKIKSGINRNPEDPNYDLYQLALKVTGTRMFPTYINMDSSFNEPYGTEVSYMGCRTRIASNVNGPAVANGRGNIAFVTINLPWIALEAKGNVDKFFEILESRMKLCEDQLIHRYNILKKLRRKDVPMNMSGLWLNSKDRPEEETIEESLKNGTLSFGYIGIYETLMALTGKGQHESQESQELGLRIAKFMYDYSVGCTERHHLNFSVIATPAESACHTLLKATRRAFGVVANVTDKEYFVNSCHVAPFARVTAEQKIKLEGPYHKYANAGHILYIEAGASPVGNIASIEKIINEACNADAGYIAINFPIDFCNGCGHLGVIPLEGCPQCGCTDIRRVRRITGYFSNYSNFNEGKLKELFDRTTHLGIPLGLNDVADAIVTNE